MSRSLENGEEKSRQARIKGGWEYLSSLLHLHNIDLFLLSDKIIKGALMKPVITKYFLKTFFIVIFSIGILLVFRFLVDEQRFLIDAGGLSGFASIFGALWGIIVAFILFVVWSQFNNTSSYIDAEANALKQLYRLVLCLKNGGAAKEIEEATRNYTKLVINVGFKTVAAGQRDPETSEAFHQIFLKVRQVDMDGERDQLVYDRILGQFKELSDARTKRLTESLIRLPKPLRIFISLSSSVVILAFSFPIFQNLSAAIFVIAVLSGSIGLLLQVIFDLDNPFVGYWNLTPEPFRRFLEFLEKE